MDPNKSLTATAAWFLITSCISNDQPQRLSCTDSVQVANITLLNQMVHVYILNEDSYTYYQCKE